MGTHEHRAKAPRELDIGILSMSSTRGLEDDRSGLWMAKRAAKEGHRVVDHQVVPDDMTAIRHALQQMMVAASPAAILMTGGTGISGRDVTLEAVRPLFSKELTAFGPIFTQLSFEQVDSAAILSRATAGVIGQTIVFCLPGSLKACQLACKALIFPELGHLIHHVREA